MLSQHKTVKTVFYRLQLVYRLYIFTVLDLYFEGIPSSSLVA